jgi:hypothetical protein
MTDFLADTEALLATVADLLRGRGQEPELDIITNAKARIEETGGDMDSVYYTVILNVGAILYASYEDVMPQIEATIKERMRALFKAQPSTWIEKVVVSPSAVVSPKWRGKVYSIPASQLLKELEAQRSTMVSVSTGGARIQTVNAEYIERRQVIADALAERRIDDPNPYADLWQWYGKWSSDLPSYHLRRTFIGEMYNELLERIKRECHAKQDRVFEEPTGWPKVDRSIGEIRRRLGEAKTEEQFQAVGLLCREALLSLAQVVYDASHHPSLDGTPISTTDTKRMLEAFLAVELEGAANQIARKHARAALDLANELTHKRTASFRLAALCAESTTSVIHLVAIVSGQRDPTGQ